MHLAEILLVLVAATVQHDALAHDAKAIPSRSHAGTAAVGASLSALAWTLHDNWYDELQGKWFIDRPSQVTDVYGSGSVNLPAAMALWTGGAITGRPALRSTGDGLTRTLILTHLVVGPLKLGAHRRRPDGSDPYSFPSGHSANTFAIARYLQRDLGTKASLLPYALAVTTALGRMEGNRHFLSDVVMGAALGIVVGSATGVDDSHPPGRAGLRLVPTTGVGARFVLPID